MAKARRNSGVGRRLSGGSIQAGFQAGGGPGLTEKKSEAPAGWNPYTGQRVFRSARAAWMIYGQYRFSVSERTFYNYIGSSKPCAPRPDGSLCVEDIELLAQSQGWPTLSLVRACPQGGEGGAGGEELEIGAEIQREKLRRLRIETESAEIDLAKKRRELLPRSEYEQRLAAAAAVVGVEAETFVYDKVREIIHACGGTPEKEDALREYLLKEVRSWLHAFSRVADYDVILVESEETDTSLHLEQPLSLDAEGSQQNDVFGDADGTADPA